jgi:polysaccharide export outer membrane protein
MITLRLWTTMLAALVLVLGGCASLPPLAETQREAPAYRLGAGDKLRVTVFGEESLSREYTITSAGDISFPLLGDLPAVGLTVAQLGQTLIQKLSAGYVNDPRVSVEVLNYRPFYILGEVSRAGEYPYNAALSALQAVALAGGFTYRAEKKRIFIRRAGETAERTYVISSDNPVWVLPGDTVRVGERYF